MTTELESGGGGSVLNIYAQLAEPSKKDGIWIKTEETKAKVSMDLADLPFPFSYGNCVAIDTNIYLFNASYDEKQTYKYDTLTNTYTQLADLPSDFKYISLVAIDTDIYLFDIYKTIKIAYKYDTLTNTYTRLKDVPKDCTNHPSVVGTNIYFFGCDSSTGNRQTYKYDTLTNTYTQLADISIGFYDGHSQAVGTNCYLFKGDSLNKYAYKYNTLTNKFTQIRTLPYIFNNSGELAVVGTDIYLLGGYEYGENTEHNNYKYSTTTNTYTKLTDIPYRFLNSGVAVIDTNIYLFNTFTYSFNEQNNYKYDTLTDTYTDKCEIDTEYPTIDKYQYNEIITTEQLPTILENDSIYIIFGSTYATKLLEQLVLNFANVQLYKNNETQPYPIYYGNGEEWIKILN